MIKKMCAIKDDVRTWGSSCRNYPWDETAITLVGVRYRPLLVDSRSSPTLRKCTCLRNDCIQFNDGRDSLQSSPRTRRSR